MTTAIYLFIQALFLALCIWLAVAAIKQLLEPDRRWQERLLLLVQVAVALLLMAFLVRNMA